ncbi:cytoskeleton-associated protein 2 isoform X1 [Anguilla anguilla]|uniref:cytoskeleton-associated protein 2 isoform X1 n=2 Tax=Anguilla anguilla TaxID=7936 RepID=UPI0015ADB5DF|nr:cytoskeleton-associated protein 2 isoform X1 [Anguilla anguilla]
MSSEVSCSTTEPRHKNMESHAAKKKTIPLDIENKAIDPVIQMAVGTKRNNKENTKPASGHSVSVTKKVHKKTTAGSTAPLRSKNDKNGENLGEELKKPTTQTVQEAKTQPSGKGDAVKRRQTLSQAFLSQHALQQRKLAAEVAKPPASVPPKPLLGAYKGRVIQSKVNSFRKPTGGSGEAEPTAAMTKQSQPKGSSKPQAAIGMRGKTPAVVPRLSTLKASAAQNSRSKSVSSNAPAPAAKPAPSTTAPRVTNSRARLQSAPGKLAKSRVMAPPARQTSGPEAAAHPGSSRSTVTAKKKEMPQVSESKAKLVVAATDNKAPKPPASRSLSQYRMAIETADERKAKLAEWLASKGKTLKRPPIASALPQTVSRAAPSESLPKPEAVTEAGDNPETEPVTQRDSDPEIPLVQQPESSPEADAKPESDPKGAPETAPFSSSDIMNTTLDLLENSEMDLPVDPEIRMADVVVNLCSAMEAMQVPSSSENDAQVQGDGEGRILEMDNQMDTLAETSKEEADLESEMHGTEEVKAEGKSSVKKSVKMECADEMDDDEEDQSETAPEGASVVRYSVKTTPYLQSMKQRIQSEAAASGSGGKRRSAIKDLKFLTPVRRSVRIQRESGRLPGMLADHDPCVASLAELVRLDDDPNAYIYRKNPALLEDLPDQPEGQGRF